MTFKSINLVLAWVLICFRHTEKMKTTQNIENMNTAVLNNIGDFFGGFITRISCNPYEEKVTGMQIKGQLSLLRSVSIR